MASIDEDGELDGARTAEVVEGIERGAGGAAAVEDIIDEDDRPLIDVAGNLGREDLGRESMIEVVAVHGDVDGADGDGVIPDFGEMKAEALSEEWASALDAEQDDLVAGGVALGDFVSDPCENSLHLRSCHEDFRFGYHCHVVATIEQAWGLAKRGALVWQVGGGGYPPPPTEGMSHGVPAQYQVEALRVST